MTRNPHRVVAALAAALFGSIAYAQAPDYALEVLTATGGELTGIDGRCSINDRGWIAFSGTTSAGNGVFVARSPGFVSTVVPPSSGPLLFGGAAINDAIVPEVAYRRQVGTTWFVYRQSIGGLSTKIGQSPTNFDSATSKLAISSNGVVAFVSLVGGSTSTAVMAGTAQPPTTLATYTGLQSQIEPCISDTNVVTIKDNLGRIISWPYPSGSPIVHASASTGGFSSVGSGCGISSDGRVVSFIGDRGNGRGAFISVQGQSGLEIFRVAGEGTDGFTDVILDAKAGVSSSGTPGNGQCVRVAFQGTRAGETGLYVATGTVSNGASSLTWTPAATRQVVRNGQVVDGHAVSGVGVWDPINNQGRLGFIAYGSGGWVGVVRATPANGSLQELPVRVSVKRVISSSGTASPLWTPANCALVLRGARGVLRRTGADIVPVTIEIVDLPDPATAPGHSGFGGPSWFDVSAANLGPMEANAKAHPTEYLWRNDAINVYMSNQLESGGACGVCSFPLPATVCPGQPLPWSDIIVVAGQPSPGCSQPPSLDYPTVTLTHELGHYFSLLHTFDTGCSTQGPEQALVACLYPPPSCEARGDFVCDTAADPNNLAQLTSLYAGCNPAAFEALRYNLMSYYGGLNVTNVRLTPGQICRMRNGLLTLRSSVIGP